MGRGRPGGQPGRGRPQAAAASSALSLAPTSTGCRYEALLICTTHDAALSPGPCILRLFLAADMQEGMGCKALTHIYVEGLYAQPMGAFPTQYFSEIITCMLENLFMQRTLLASS